MGKRVLFLSNGYGEDSFAALILEELLNCAENENLPLLVDIVPLVGEGKAFEHLCRHFSKRARLLHISPVLPYGGVYLGGLTHRLFRFLLDFFSGGCKNILAVARLVHSLAKLYDIIFGVGDILPLLLGLLFGRKKVYLFACAHTDLLRVGKKPYERLGRLTAFFLRHGAALVYTRDIPTAVWFQSLGIKAVFPGFVGPEIGSPSPERRCILFLPGHRRDWERNFLFLVEVMQLAGEVLKPFVLHFVFPPERTLTDIKRVFASAGGELLASSAFRLGEHCVSFSQGDYFSRLREAALVVGFAGTAFEHAAFCGIPCIEPYFEGNIQANPDFLFRRQSLLLREALILGGTTPGETARILRTVLDDLPAFQRRAQEFSFRIWGGRGDGARNIARDLLNILHTLPGYQGKVPVLGGSHTGTL